MSHVLTTPYVQQCVAHLPQVAEWLLRLPQMIAAIAWHDCAGNILMPLL